MFRSKLSQKEMYDRHFGYEVSLQDTFNALIPKGNDPKKRIKAIGSATLQQHLTAVDIIHSKIAAGGDVASGQMVVCNESYEDVPMATPVRRLDILDHSLVAAQSLITEFKHQRGDMDNLLERLGNLSAFGITLSHIYADANGTTARAYAHLIRYGSSRKNSPEAWKAEQELGILKAYNPWDYVGLKRYEPLAEWKDKAIEDPEAFLDHVAAFDIPFDSVAYEEATKSTVQTPYPVPPLSELHLCQTTL